MCKKSNIMLLWIYFWGIMSILFYMTLTDWGAWGAIISAIVLIGGLIVTLCRKIQHNRKFSQLKVTYVIPQSKYPKAHFCGAPDSEGTPLNLTVGIGHYRLMHNITPKVDILIDPIILRFDGPSLDKPSAHGPDNPFIVQRIDNVSGSYYLDWWGDVQPAPQGWPRYIHAGETLSIGNRIETTGPWKGKTYFELPIRNKRVLKKKLDFGVTDNENEDQIPFLKGWTDDK